MRRQRVIEANSDLLTVIEREFSAFRQVRSGSRQRCPDELRGLVFVNMTRRLPMIGHKAFSSGRMCNLLQWAARLLVPVYKFLGESLGDAAVLAGDDTPTKVLDLETEVTEDDPLSELDEHFGFQSERADGKGDKKTLNVSTCQGCAGGTGR